MSCNSIMNNEKCYLYKNLEINYTKMAVITPPYSSNMNQVFCRITTDVNQLSKTRCLSILVCQIAYLFANINQFLNNICVFGSNGIKTFFSFTIAKRISIFNLALIFYKKEPKSSKKKQTKMFTL